jgi:hypothetical protein
MKDSGPPSRRMAKAQTLKIGVILSLTLVAIAMVHGVSQHRVVLDETSFPEVRDDMEHVYAHEPGEGEAYVDELSPEQQVEPRMPIFPV